MNEKILTLKEAKNKAKDEMILACDSIKEVCPEGWKIVAYNIEEECYTLTIEGIRGEFIERSSSILELKKYVEDKIKSEIIKYNAEIEDKAKNELFYEYFFVDKEKEEEIELRNKEEEIKNIKKAISYVENLKLEEQITLYKNELELAKRDKTIIEKGFRYVDFDINIAYRKKFKGYLSKIPLDVLDELMNIYPQKKMFDSFEILEEDNNNTLIGIVKVEDIESYFFIADW